MPYPITPHPETQKRLSAAGYDSIFDIIQGSQADLQEALPDMDINVAQAIYQQARLQANTLRTIFRAWQLRHETTLASLEKLAPSPAYELYDLLQRSVGEESDFADLMARSSRYTDAASVVSLFSPGRYAAALYKVAKTLHATTSPQHIDRRRPDLKLLILSENTMNDEVTALDILLEVLQEGTNSIAQLDNKYFPMSLPYDDALNVTEQALTAQGLTLNGVWHAMANTISDIEILPSAAARSTLSLTANSYALMLKQESTLTAPEVGAHYGLGPAECDTNLKLASALNNVDTFSQQTALSFNEVVELTAQPHPLIVDETGIMTFEFKGNQDRLFMTLTIDVPAGVMTIKQESGVPHSSYYNAYVQIGYYEPPGNVNGSTQDADLYIAPRGNVNLNASTTRYAIKPGGTLHVWHAEAVDKQRVVLVNHTTNTRYLFTLKTQRYTLTATGLQCIDPKPSTPQATFPASRLYHKFGIPVDVRTFGAAGLNQASSVQDQSAGVVMTVTPEVRDSSGAITIPASLNFTQSSVASLTGRAEKLIRLRQKTGLSFADLDWLAHNSNQQTNYLILTALCLELHRRYGIDIDTAVSFFGSLNPYAPVGEISALERHFTRLAAPPLTVNILNGTGEPEDACCSALGVTREEFTRIARYCFGEALTFTLTPLTAGQIYRFSAIPRMLGLTFAEAEALWYLMAGEQDTFLLQLGRNANFFAYTLIRRTEQVLAWMNENTLPLPVLQAMVTTRHSESATAHMFTFLHNISQSVITEPAVTRNIQDSLAEQMYRAMAGEFNIKSNIMGALTDWLTQITEDDDEHAFTVHGYWEAIANFFRAGNKTLSDLQTDDTLLVFHTQRLSQLVVIARSLGLNEQTLRLLIDTPAHINPELTRTSLPDIPMLMLLSHFLRWQHDLTTPQDEALVLLSWLNDANACTDARTAAARIAAIHDRDIAPVSQVIIRLFGADAWPKDFVQLHWVLNWLKTGDLLNVGTDALSDLWTMQQMPAQTHDPALFARVASALAAGLTR